ncbi:MBL fold metallo-hydrolase [Piscinibacter sakaiensis]|uniref:MBL fold metallo-hydrolase n=1 Tax=Piscinibacter sakaiensis TaxID=1547922 RepID=UPI003AAB81DB
MLIDTHSGTRIDEIADGIHRISTPMPPSVFPGGFSFNQYLVLDDEPLLFHTGMRSIFPLVREAIAAVMPLERLRYLALSHFESDECGALNDFLQVAPHSVPVCSTTAAMVSVGDFALRPPRALADGEMLRIGKRQLMWLDTPHLPHNWETGLMWEPGSRTLLCGDLFTQGGHELPPLTSDDLLAPSEAFRRAGVAAGEPDPYSLGPGTATILERLAGLQPRTLAVMHGSVFQARRDDDGAAMLRGLARELVH